MIPHAFEPDTAEDVETFTVLTSPDHVEIAADHAGVPVSIVDGEYVALVPCPIGFLRYSAPVPADEAVKGMSTQFQPGDVAMVCGDAGDGEERAFRAYVVEIDQIVWWTADGYWRDGNVTAVRPLLVIDPEDPADVQRVRDALWRGGTPRDWQERLRSLAVPKPPEPKGLGAVVRDDAGRIYTRYETDSEPQPWWQSANGPEHDVVRRFAWADIDVVKVVSGGVTP